MQRTSNAVNSAVAGMGSKQANQPMEIGYIQRIYGVSAGLATISDRLSQLSSKIAGHPSCEGEVNPLPAGIPSLLESSEDSIRRIFSQLDTLENSF